MGSTKLREDYPRRGTKGHEEDKKQKKKSEELKQRTKEQKVKPKSKSQKAKAEAEVAWKSLFLELVTSNELAARSHSVSRF
jgi:hypothetical protein